MSRQKRVAAIHDVSGFGKCSLTVALPVLSAAGIETAVMPTAVLSTHTACKPGYTYRDLTADLLPFAQNWKENDLHFDAIYSGFLGSAEQIDMVRRIFSMLADENTLLVVDPAMADNGKMYSVFDKNFALEMQKLCAEADVIVPNFTEAAFMLGEEYREPPYSEDYVRQMLSLLSGACGASVVLTGVSYNAEQIGAASYVPKTGAFSQTLTPKVGGMYHGTGDVFASVLTAGLVNGQSLATATDTAVQYTYACIDRTFREYPYMTYGVDFESGLYQMKEITQP